MRTVTFDGGPLAEAARRLVYAEASPLSRLVYLVEQDSMVPGKPPVVMFTDTQERRWSHGEELLWNFLGGLVGVARCDLAAVASYFKAGPLRGELVLCLEVLFGVELALEELETTPAPDTRPIDTAVG